MAKSKKAKKNVVTWEDYEQVANYVVERARHKFGLREVEGKQEVPGLTTGTVWEIDGKGIQSQGGSFVIIEARRHTKSRLSQEQLAGVAFRVIDTGAEGAITVSPLPLQKGAELVENASNIEHIELDPTSTKEQWAAKIKGIMTRGFTETAKLTIKERVDVRQYDGAGKLVTEEVQKDFDDD